MKIYITDKSGFSARYALKEIRHFISSMSRSYVVENADSADAVITLGKIDAAGRGYSISHNDIGGVPELVVSGTDGAALLYGVYRCLGKAGIRFGIGGYGLKSGFSALEAEKMFLSEDERVTFDYRYRGIRQHINFPMDISSYRLDEAKEYIRNLARTGYDHITFHSYMGMWHGGTGQRGGGNFFYDQLYRLPEEKELRDLIDNREIYCIPELEPYSGDHAARGKAAAQWLLSLMETAKECMMHIILSVEPHGSDDIGPQLEMVKNLLSDYPVIDGLEIISTESGGGCPTFDASEFESRMTDCFGSAAVLPSKYPEKITSDLSGAVRSLRKAKAIYDNLKDTALKDKEFCAGVYITDTEALTIVKPVMYRLFDENVKLTFLPAHGSYYVAQNVSALEFTPEELSRTVIYGWLEFDGSMYLMQNGCGGMERILDTVRSRADGTQTYCVAFNHWRTAENAIPGGYGARASAGFITASDYYKMTASEYGISDTDGFAALMEHIASNDLLLRRKLFNIGFCYLGCYLNWGRDNPVSWIGQWESEAVEKALEGYEAAASEAEALIPRAAGADGIYMLRFMKNRCLASSLHIRYILAMRDLSPISSESVITEQMKSEAALLTDRAEKYAQDYLRLTGEMMPDRGCQGTLVSYFATVLSYIDYTRRFLLEGRRDTSGYNATFDCPTPEGL